MAVKSNLLGTMEQSFEIGKTDTVGIRSNSGVLQGQDNGAAYANLLFASLGRSGGQEIIGGTASGDDLTLSSTSNATKGNIITTDGMTITIPNTQNQVGLAVTQNDTTNNPDAFTITNAGTGNDFEINTTEFIVNSGVATTTTVNATTFDTNIAAAGATFSGTTLAADGTDTHIDITLTPKGNAGLVMPNAAGAPSVTTNKLYQTGGVLYFDGVSLEGAGSVAFTGLTDTPSGYTTGNAIYTTNGTPDGVIETTVVLTEGVNTFNITKGTGSLDIAAGSALDVNANLTVSTAVTLDQAVASGSSPTFSADNFSDGGSNAIITTTQESNFESAYSHVTNNGTDHGYINQDLQTTASPTFAGLTCAGSSLLTTVDTNVAAAGLTLSGTTLAADGTDTHIDITVTPKGNAGVVLPNAAGAPAITTSKLYQTGGVLYFDGVSLEAGGGSSTFEALTDTPTGFTTATSIYIVNGAGTAVAETTTLLTEPSANQFQIARGTTAALFQGDLTVEATSLINQDVTTDAAPTFAGATLTGDVTTTGAAVDWDLQDNVASALSFDAAGQAGILEIITTDGAEGVDMSGTLHVDGHVGIGTAVLSTVVLDLSNTVTSTSGSEFGGRYNLSIMPSGASTADYSGGSNTVTAITSSNITGDIVGQYNVAGSVSTGTISEMIGGKGRAFGVATSVVTHAAGLQAESLWSGGTTTTLDVLESVCADTGGTFTDVNIANFKDNSSGTTVTNKRGLLIDDISGATTINRAIETGLGDVVFGGSLDVAGNSAFGSATVSVDYTISIDDTLTQTTGSRGGQYVNITADPSGASTGSYYGALYAVTVDSGNAENITGGVNGFVANVTHSGSGTVDEVLGANLAAVTQGSGTVTDCAAVNAIVGTIGGTLTNGIGAWIRTPYDFGGTTTNSYGLKIEDISTGDTINRAIETGLGDVIFGDDVDIAGHLALADSSVDADDTLQLWDTTTSTSNANNLYGWLTINPATGSSATYNGFNGAAQVSGSCAQDLTGWVRGINFIGRHSGTGTLSNLCGCYVVSDVSGAGTATAAHGVFIDGGATGASSVITEFNGLNIEAIDQTGTVTTSRAIYQQGANDTNSFAGPSTFGSVTTFNADLDLTDSARDVDLVDNTASALSFDADGQAGILEIATTNGSEGVNMAGFLNVAGTVFGTTFDTDIAAAGLTMSGTTIAADGTDTHIDITLTPKGNAGLVIPNAAGAPAVTTNKLYQTGGVVYFDGVSLEGGGTSTFEALTDTPVGFTTANAIYTINGAGTAVIETTTLLTEPSANQFQIARGTTAALFQGDLTVEATSILNQDLTTDSTPTFGQITMSTGATDTYIIQGNGSGVMTWTDPSTVVSGANGTLGLYDNYIYTETGSNNLGSPVAQNGIITKFVIDVTTAFDGSTPTITIGDAGDADRFVTTADVDLETTGTYVIDVFYRYGSQTQVTATISASGASQGVCDVIGLWTGS